MTTRCFTSIPPNLVVGSRESNTAGGQTSRYFFACQPQKAGSQQPARLGVCPDRAGGFMGTVLASHVQVAHLFGVSLDEPLAGGYTLAHQHIEGAICDGRILDGHLQEGALLRVHRRLPELIRVHLAQPLVALESDLLALQFSE